MSDEPQKLPDGFKSYEEGKQRRYGLLFAVNGGAFAVARLMSAKNPSALGLLYPWALAAAMIVFTIAMGLTFTCSARRCVTSTSWMSSAHPVGG